METDEMQLDTIGDRKTALFVIISDTDDTFNFVVSILYTQLFNLLCDKADDEYGGRLPVHVRCLLDEFANIGQIPKFEKLIATIRSREISASIILQSQSQLKAIYKDNADTIVGNCDTTLFLGGKEKTTLKEISEILGKETIDSFNTSETRGRELSHGLNYQKLGKQLIAALRDGLIETEARRIVREMKRHYEPNSPNKTHFMVELSPAFMQLAATKDTDRLFSMLPYKTLSFSKIEGRHGTYALIGKGENRDREIRKPRPSVRAQLKTDKAKTAPKKAAAKTKNHDLEV